MLLGGTMGQGPMRPPYPRKRGRGLCAPRSPGSRGIAPAPILRYRRLLFQTSFRMLLEETEREPTGAMKTKKRAAERMHSLTASFCRFPRMHSIRSAVFHTAQPVGGSAAASSQRNNLPLQRGFCVAPVAHPICKETIFLCKRMCACYFAAPGNCLFDMNCSFRKKGQGAMPLVGCRGEAPQVSPCFTGKLFV